MDAEIMESSLLRKLAVRLACIHPEDREWILAQLDSAERQRIDELLEEINTLGLAKDPSVVNAVMAELVEQAPALAAEYTSMIALVDKAEHPLWGGMVLQLKDEGDRNKVIAALPNATQVRRWEGVFAEHPAPPALVQSLYDHLYGSLNEQSGGLGRQESGNERA